MLPESLKRKQSCVKDKNPTNNLIILSKGCITMHVATIWFFIESESYMKIIPPPWNQSLLTRFLTWQWVAILLASMAYTFLAPAWTAKNDRIPDPAPTSNTTWRNTHTYLIWVKFVKVWVNCISQSIRYLLLNCQPRGLCCNNGLSWKGRNYWPCHGNLLSWPTLPFGMLMFLYSPASCSVVVRGIHKTTK